MKDRQLQNQHVYREVASVATMLLGPELEREIQMSANGNASQATTMNYKINIRHSYLQAQHLASIVPSRVVSTVIA